MATSSPTADTHASLVQQPPLALDQYFQPLSSFSPPAPPLWLPLTPSPLLCACHFSFLHSPGPTTFRAPSADANTELAVIYTDDFFPTVAHTQFPASSQCKYDLSHIHYQLREQISFSEHHRRPLQSKSTEGPSRWLPHPLTHISQWAVRPGEEASVDGQVNVGWKSVGSHFACGLHQPTNV